MSGKYYYKSIDIADYLDGGTTNDEGYTGFPGSKTNIRAEKQNGLDGYNYISTSIVSNKKCKYDDFTSTQNNLEFPSWCTKVRILIIGAGGGGGGGGKGQRNTGNTPDGIGGGGGGGGGGLAYLFERTLSSTSRNFNIEIGAAGTGGLYSDAVFSGEKMGQDGNSGNTTHFKISDQDTISVSGANGGGGGSSRYGNNGKIYEAPYGNSGNVAYFGSYNNIVNVNDMITNSIDNTTKNSYSNTNSIYTNPTIGNKGNQEHLLSGANGGSGGTGGKLKLDDVFLNLTNTLGYGKGGDGGKGWDTSEGTQGNNGTQGFIRVYYFG